MKLNFQCLKSSLIPIWENKLRTMEEAFVYPLGNDQFTISHGRDYLAFFKRIGQESVHLVTHENEIAAVGAGVISKRLRAWYLCDMKVQLNYRGQKIPKRLFRKTFFLNYLKCSRGFALTMEGSGEINPILKIIQNLPWAPLKLGGRVLFYYEDTGETSKALEILCPQRPSAHFSSLRGIKDLVLKSTLEPLPLLHMEWGPSREGEHSFIGPQSGKLHMWCLDEKDPLVKKLSEIGIQHKASGLIFQHRMGKQSWSELRTSEL